MQTHGRQDQILPFAAAIALRELLTEAGANVNFIEFNGPHTITLPGLEALVELLERQLPE